MVDKDLMDLKQSLDTSAESSDMLYYLLIMDPNQDFDEDNSTGVVTEPETSNPCNKPIVLP